MKKQLRLSVLLTVLMSMIGAKALAYEFQVENNDGITIYYNYTNDGKELEVTYGEIKYSGDLVIPEKVFFMNRTRKVTSIGISAFHDCIGLTSVTLPNGIISIGQLAFSENNSLKSVYIPTTVTSIGEWAFLDCSALISIALPDGLTSIKLGTFQGCRSLQSIVIPNSVTVIDADAFDGCSSLTAITLPNSLTGIGGRAFGKVDLQTVVSMIENPFRITGNIGNYRTFSQNTFNNATLYVPVGTIDKYKSTEGWKDFMFIEEGTGPGGDTPGTQKCSKPTISYKNGKLTFNCDTEGATCQYSITDDDIKSGSGYEVQLGVTYNISVYATKAGYDDSDKATATLCWIDVEPRTEGITNIAQIRANAIMIQSGDGVLNVSGVDDGQIVSVYSVSGQIMGTSKASNNQATIATNLKQGEIAIVKIGEKSVKVVIQ